MYKIFLSHIGRLSFFHYTEDFHASSPFFNARKIRGKFWRFLLFFKSNQMRGPLLSCLRTNLIHNKGIPDTKLAFTCGVCQLPSYFGEPLEFYLNVKLSFVGPGGPRLLDLAGDLGQDLCGSQATIAAPRLGPKLDGDVPSLPKLPPSIRTATLSQS